MARETSAGIAAWGDAAFGPARDLFVLTARARQELNEVEAAIATAAPADIAQEAADVAILLHRLVGLLGKELADEVDAKMSINRQRQWRQSGDGVGQHIPE